jgi:hypothetical protein
MRPNKIPRSGREDGDRYEIPYRLLPRARALPALSALEGRAVFGTSVVGDESRTRVLVAVSVRRSTALGPSELFPDYATERRLERFASDVVTQSEIDRGLIAAARGAHLTPKPGENVVVDPDRDSRFASADGGRKLPGAAS